MASWKSISTGRGIGKKCPETKESAQKRGEMPTKEGEMITLENLCGREVKRAIDERLNKAIERAYLNLMDEDTDQEEKRVVTMKITMKQEEESIISVTADVSTKVAKEKSIGTFIPKERGQAYIDAYGIYRMADPETGEMMEAEDE